MGERQERKEKRIRNFHKQGLSIATIAMTERITHEATCAVLGISVDNVSQAYANIHIGCDLDKTGVFKEISTKRWV